jgi:hypothetical protein
MTRIYIFNKKVRTTGNPQHLFLFECPVLVVNYPIEQRSDIISIKARFKILQVA